LVADRDAPRKQRHTAHRIWQRLRDEYGAEVAESTVRGYVAELRYELNNELSQVTVPQLHAPGEEAEVDFGEFWSLIDGQLTKLWMFCMRLSNSGKGFHIAFAHEAQEAFLEGHVLAFEYFGGIPGRIRYDNLKTAVVRVMMGRGRQETDRFVALRSHYGFDSFFCLPGIEGAHEKGGVEGEIGRFRRNHLVPMPDICSLDELNQLMAAADEADDSRHIARRVQSVGEAATAELAYLGALPEQAFDAVNLLRAKVDTKGRICVRQSFYSVPVLLARREVTVRLAARTIEAVHDGKVVANHVRSLTKGTETLVLDHYLEILDRKPGALPGSTALSQARSSGAFTAVHEQFWVEARRRLGDAAGTRALIEVLLLERRLPSEVVRAAAQATLEIGSVDPEVVAIEARRLTAPRPAVPLLEVNVINDPRPLPQLHGYDQLLSSGAIS
jgi:transposase